MKEFDNTLPIDSKALQSLRNLLHSDISISKPEKMTFGREYNLKTPEQDGVEIIIKVQNTAPTSPDGGEVVFLGVGLRISDGREPHTMKWVSTIKKSRPSDHQDLRQRYSIGSWLGGNSSPFPAVTADEQSHGEALFSGESIVYEIKVPSSLSRYSGRRIGFPTSSLPYCPTDGGIEGLETASRS